MSLPELIERARRTEVRADLAEARVAELMRWAPAIEPSRSRWLPFGAGLAVVAAAAAMIVWMLRTPPPESSDHVEIVSEPGARYHIATPSSTATEIVVDRGAVTVKVHKSKVEVVRPSPAPAPAPTPTPITPAPAANERWREIRKLRAENRLESAVTECIALADQNDPTWSPIALVEAIRIEIGPLAAPERAIELADRMLREWPQHALAPETRELRKQAISLRP